MTAKELIEYLQRFDENAHVHIPIINYQKNIVHKIEECVLIADDEVKYPCIILSTLVCEEIPDGSPESMVDQFMAAGDTEND